MNISLPFLFAFITLGVVLLYFLFPYVRYSINRYLAERLYEQTSESVTLENLQCSFNTSYSRKKVAQDILYAVKSDYLDPHDFDLTPNEIKDICKDHLNQIMAAYEKSFASDYWKTYKQTAVGYSNFLRVASTLNELPGECVTTIRAKFCRTLYLLLTKEQFHSLDNGAVQKKLEKDFGFLDHQIEDWCLSPSSNRIIHRRARIPTTT